MKYIALISTSLILGIIIGKFAFSTNEVVIRSETIPIQTQSDKQLNSLTEAFYNLSQKDFLEYTKLKSEKEKYEKADEILGKVMLLFLANIGLKVNQDVKSYFVEGKKEPITQNISVKPRAKKMPEVKVLKNNLAFKKSKRFEIKEENFENIQNSMPVEINKPYYTFKNAEAYKKAYKIKVFNGKFTGKMLYLKGKNKNTIHDVELNMNFFDREGRIDGTYESKLSFAGKAYSHNRGSGGNRQIRYAKGLKGYLLETSPNSFFHLVYKSSEDYFIGKYYDDDEYVGLVEIFPAN